MQSFHLLHLPFPALREMLRCLNPIELLILSQASFKMASHISLGHTKNFRISANFSKNEISINETYVFKLNSSKKKKFKNEKVYDFHFNNADHKFSVTIYMSLKQPNIVRTNFNNAFQMGKALLLLLIRTFKCQITECVFMKTNFDGAHQELWEDLIKNQVAIKSFTFGCEQISSSNMIWVLDSLSGTDNLSININLQEGFLYNFKKPVKQLTIENASWVDVSTILTLKQSSVIILFKSKLTNNDIDWLLKLWKEELFPNLEFLHVKGDKLDWRSPIGDVVFREEPTSQTTNQKIINGSKYEVVGGREIQRKDRVKGLFCHHVDDFRLII